MKVIKRSGEEQMFDAVKIRSAIEKANGSVEESKRLEDNDIGTIAATVSSRCLALSRPVGVEEIQDMVEHALMEFGAYEIAKSYVLYRYSRSLARKGNTTDDSILALVRGSNAVMNEENSNKNTMSASTQRDYIAGIVSRDITSRLLLPPDIRKAHEEGLIHFHDADYAIMRIFNCCLVNLDDMLQNGTCISGAWIDRPKSFSTACTVATQIIASVASGQYGGQSISLCHLAKFVQDSRVHIRERMEATGVRLSPDQLDRIVESELAKEIQRGVQTLQYQINTLMTTNGQTPFVTVFIYLGEAKDPALKKDLATVAAEVFRQRMQGIKNTQGVYVTPAFPKLIYVLEEANVDKDSEFWWLTELAARCTAKRMVPDYISEKIMRELKLAPGMRPGEGDCYTCMGCRSFLTPDRSGNGFGNISNAGNYDGGRKYYGRFNCGVVTVNLPDAAMSAHGDLETFWKVLDERLELCHKALALRHSWLRGVTSDVSPIHWQYGAIARLPKGAPITPLLFGGYSTLSLGYAGLWECVYALIGRKLTTPEGRELGLEVMRRLNDACGKWREAENIDYSLYGTPIESLTYKFAKALQERWGVVPGVSDHSYITNSYHVHVTEPIDAFSKLAFEAEFQKLSPGGAISYVEVPNMQDNIPAVLSVMRFIYDHIMYAELNTKSDYCQVCGFDGEIRIVDDGHGKLVWECPRCGNRDQSRMNVARRTCGYIGSNFWNQGRTQEIRDRVLHL